MRLDERIPEKGFAHPDQGLDAFLAWVAESGLRLYPHQEEAVLEIWSGRHVVLDAPTGSGKSLVATALHFKAFCELGRSWYTAPIKALVSEKFFALCKLFGPEHVGLMTGDGTVNRNAPIMCCTAEVLANLALREGDRAPVDAVVMDEFHYYGDRDRGMAWQVPLLTLPRATFLLMSATLGDTSTIRADLERRTGRAVAEVRGAVRPVPLEYSWSMRPTHEALNLLTREGKAPVYVVHFTQNDATDRAQSLMSVDWCTKEEKKALAEAVRGFRFTSPFGPTLRRYVLHGVGLHHAGLLPRYRLLVEKLAQQGLLKVICGTDTLGVGINVPIRTVLFTQLCKYDGEKVDILKVRDFKQIAGRAGRAGFDTVGHVVVQAPEHVIENARIDAKVTDPKQRRKIVRAQPPERGYKHWDEQTFRQLVDRPPEPLTPVFTVDHGRLLTLMQHAQDTGGDARGGVDQLLALIDESHVPPAARELLRKRTETLLEDLRRARVVGMDGEQLTLDPTLQRDFSLHHSLSLFLLDALANLDAASDTYALDVLTWVEAILEQPRAVLFKQADRERFKKLQELKAAGVPYEDRQTALEDITWPRPFAEEIYTFFNAYAEEHPWVKDHDIFPKAVAREMAETWVSFGDYVKDLNLPRSEGVLLRYLTDVYKALVQNVPADRHTPALDEVQAWLRALLALTDASLLTEWETLLRGAEVVDAPPPTDISADRKSFVARVRAELHTLVRALSLGEWEEAAGCVRRVDGDPWDAADWERALGPFLAEFGAVGFDGRARLAAHTHVRAVGPHQFEVRQQLFPPQRPDEDPDELGAWAIVGRVDLRADTNPDGPLVEVMDVG